MHKKHSNDLITLVGITLATLYGSRLLIRQDLHPARAMRQLIAELAPLSASVQNHRFAQLAPEPEAAPVAVRAPARQTANGPLGSDAARLLIQTEFSLTDSDAGMIHYSEASGHAFVSRALASGDRVEALVKVNDPVITRIVEVPHGPGAWTLFSPGGETGVVLSNKPGETSYLFSLGNAPVRPIEFVLSSTDYVTEEPQFSKSGQYLVVWTSSRGLIHLVESRTGKVRKLNEAHTFSDKLISMVFSPDDSHLVASAEGEAGIVMIFDLEDSNKDKSIELSGMSRPVLLGFSGDAGAYEVQVAQKDEAGARRPASQRADSIRVDLKTGSIVTP